MFTLNALLHAAGIDPATVAVCLHTPRHPLLARLLPLLADTEPDLFNTYQSTHGGPATATLRRRAHMASFVRVAAGHLAFVALYRVAGQRERTRADLLADPMVGRLMADFGQFQALNDPTVSGWTWFDLESTDSLAAYRGRIQIAPRLTQAYMRRAETLNADIVALSPASVLHAAAPDWQDFIVTTPEIRAMPAPWQARLREWRGIYLITDEADGQRYVGSASGADNLLARWRAHVAGNRGITAQLATRDPITFRFSILRRLDPDMPAADVVAVETSWKQRLHTRRFGLNVN